jgi:HEAT repeat protein
LHDPNAEVVVSAARALAVLGAKFDRGFAAGAVHEALTETSYIELIMPLAQLAGTRSWAVIEPLLESDDASARALGVNALALTRDTRGVARLIDFTRSEDVPLAAQSTMVLGLIGGIEAADRLVALLREDDATLRAPAVRAITLLSGPPAATGRQAIFDAVLREPVGDDILLALISATYLEPLEHVMTEATVSTKARIAVLRTLATVADPATVPVSAMALQDIDPEVRRDAVMALSSVGNEPAMRHLVRAAGDAEAGVRAAAVEGMALHRYEWAHAERDPVLDALARALDDPDARVRGAAINTLGKLGEPIGRLESIINLATGHQDPQVSGKAKSILEDWGMAENQRP